jgi:hypothetical protein
VLQPSVAGMLFVGPASRPRANAELCLNGDYAVSDKMGNLASHFSWLITLRDTPTVQSLVLMTLAGASPHGNEGSVTVFFMF